MTRRRSRLNARIAVVGFLTTQNVSVTGQTEAVPKRTNEKQLIIKLLQDLLSDVDSTITESEFLFDPVLNKDREVDIVAELHVDGDTVIHSFEVAGRKQPTDVTWAEQLIKKHEGLATSHLYLVSWSGVSETVRALVAAHPWVSLVTPEVIEGPDGPVVKSLFADVVRLQPMEVVATVERPNGEQGKAILEHDFIVCSAAGSEIGGAGELYGEILTNGDTIEMVLRQVHDHPEREELKSFVLGRDYSALGFYLRKDEPTVELQKILTIEVTGGVVFEQAPLDMEVRTFGEQRFAHGRTSLMGSDGVVVTTLDDQLDMTKLRVQFGATKAPRGNPRTSMGTSGFNC